MTSAKVQKGSERIFIMPFLVLIDKYGIRSTADILIELRDWFNPIGYDAGIMAGRADDYFSQRVRNIKSHNTIDQWADYDKNKGWTLKPEGKDFLNTNKEMIEDLMNILNSSTADYYDKITFIDLLILPLFPRRKLNKPTKSSTASKTKEKKVILYDENISEGAVTSRSIVVRERSKKLRDAAVEFYSTKEGKIICSICGFDFENIYGEYGKGYIEIHHKKPVYQYGDENVDKMLKEALENLTPVCANCHRMLHHRKNISFEEVKKIYEDNNKDH